MINYWKHKLRHQFRYLHNMRRTSLAVQFLVGVLEYYDFFAFGFVFFYLSQIFVGHFTLIYEMGLVALISFLCRPIGYRLYLYIRPKFSRNTIITGNFILMTFSIISTGLLPSDAREIWLIFTWLIVGRIINGISFGLKLQSNVRFIHEAFPKRIHSTIASSIIGAQLGLTLAAFVYKMVFTHLTAEQLTWGWRLPFFIGGGMSVLLYIFRLKLYSSIPEPVSWSKLEPLDITARKSGSRLWLGLMLASSRACLIFSTFVIIPGFFTWILKWNAKETTDVMLAISMLSTWFTWISRRNKANSLFNCKLLVPALFLAIPVSGLLGIGLNKLNQDIIICACLMLAMLNGYLFVAIPQFIEKYFAQEYRLESMLFIGNLEFFNFNLIRRGGIIAIILFLGKAIEMKHYILILCSSIWLTVFAAIFAAMKLKRLKKYR